MSILSLFGNRSGVQNLGAEEFAEGFHNTPDAELIDVRTPVEYDMGHIPGATLIDISSPDFKSQIEQLDRSKHYYVYCRSGSRSMHACRFMTNLGFENTYNLGRGIIGWNGELVRGEERRNGTD